MCGLLREKSNKSKPRVLLTAHNCYNSMYLKKAKYASCTDVITEQTRSTTHALGKLKKCKFNANTLAPFFSFKHARTLFSTCHGGSIVDRAHVLCIVPKREVREVFKRRVIAVRWAFISRYAAGTR